ncbi:MAG TPA: hypothetical protein VGO89_04955 [Streptomyces sp.]|nr:hypothetical protein [Streptomyces sp.]
MSAHRRSLVTATAAGAVLCALWFVPSANAAPDATGVVSQDAESPASGGTDSASGRTHSAAHLPQGSSPAALQPGGGADVHGGHGTPYILGGVGLAGAGGALIVRSRRRAAAGRTRQTSSPVAD